MTSPFSVYFDEPAARHITKRADANTGSIYDRVCWVYSLSDYLIFWRTTIAYYKANYGFTDDQIYNLVFLPGFWKPYYILAPDGTNLGIINSGSGYTTNHLANAGIGQTGIFSDKVNYGATAAFGVSGTIYFNELDLDFAGGLTPDLQGPDHFVLAPPENYDSWSYVYRAVSKPAAPANGFAQLDFDVLAYSAFIVPPEDVYAALISPVWPPAPTPPAPVVYNNDLDLSGLKSRTPLNNFGFTFNFLKGKTQ